MKRGKLFIKILVAGAICLLMIPSLQGAFVDIQSSERYNTNEGNDSEPRDTISYQNCIVYIFGKCKTVVGPLTWIFGFYRPLFKFSLNLLDPYFLKIFNVEGNTHSGCIFKI